METRRAFGAFLPESSGGQGGGSYTLPVATNKRLGGVKRGDGVSIAGDGTLSSFGVISAGISVSANVGGYVKGDWIPAGTQIPVILNKLLAPSEKPTLTPPSVSMRSTAGALPQYAEVGSEVYVGDIILEYDRGKIEPAYGTDGYRAGAAQSYSLKVGDAPEEVNGNGVFGVSRVTRQSKGGLSIVGAVNHAAGQQPRDSQGADYQSALPAGTLTATHHINFILAFYYGATPAGEVTDFSGLTRDLSGKGTKTYYIDANAQYPTFIYDAAYGYLSSLKDQNGFECIYGFDVSRITVNGNQYIMYRQQNYIVDTHARHVLVF